MRKQGFLGGLVLALIAVTASALLMTGQAGAVTSSSSHYSINDSSFNATNTAQTCSSTYCAQAGVGNAAGTSASTSNSATFGPATGSDPLLDVSVDGGSSDLGLLTTEATAIKTMTVKVRSYLSSGYILQISGTPPKYAGHSITALTSPTASIPGTEQFGINAVANTTPNVGADPLQLPNTQTSFGLPVAGYNTANLFKYVSGDIVARSPKSSGETDFTISMIVNISNGTPAGRYSADFSAVVVPVY